MDETYLKRQYQLISILLMENNAYITEAASYIEITLKHVTNSNEDYQFLAREYISDKELENDIHFKIRLKSNDRKHETASSTFYNNEFSKEQALEIISILDRYIDYLTQNFNVDFKYRKFSNIYKSEKGKQKDTVVIKEVEKIVEKEVPVEVEKIVEKEVPVEVKKIVEKKVPVKVEKKVYVNKRSKMYRTIIILLLLIIIGLGSLTAAVIKDHYKSDNTGNSSENDKNDQKENDTQKENDKLDNSEKINESKINDSQKETTSKSNSSQDVKTNKDNNSQSAKTSDNNSNNTANNSSDKTECSKYCKLGKSVVKNKKVEVYTQDYYWNFSEYFGLVESWGCEDDPSSSKINNCFKQSYSSSNPSVATVNSDGKVVVHKHGTAELTGCIEVVGGEKKCNTGTIVAKPRDELCEIIDSSVNFHNSADLEIYRSLNLYELTNLNAASNCSTTRVEYSSDNSNIASINNNGVVTGKSIGSTKVHKCFVITETNTKLKCYDINLNIIHNPKGVECYGYDTTIVVGSVGELYGGISVVYYAGSFVEYKSSNSNIVKVDSSGKITGVSPGTAIITAKHIEKPNYELGSCSWTITVVDY